jgi:hypothetical protein
MNLQARHDLRIAERAAAARLRRLAHHDRAGAIHAG